MKPLFCATLVVTSLVTWRQGIWPHLAKSDAPPPAAVAAVTVSPVLTSVPKSIVLPRDGSPTMLTLAGDHFGPDVSVQLTSMSYTFTYGRESLNIVDARKLQMDAAALEDGVYTVCVRSGALRSGQLQLQVAHK